MLQNSERGGLIRGIRVARGAPSVSHLFFADDSLLFFRALEEEASQVLWCLSEYERLSGQVINFHKSSVCFSLNTPEAVRRWISSFFKVTEAEDFGKYLGLPSFLGRNKRAVFSYIADRIRQRVTSWNKKLLSKGGNHGGGIKWMAWERLTVPKKFGGMSFRNFSAFNVALLAKQGWRFMVTPDALVSRVYKARHAPRWTRLEICKSCAGQSGAFGRSEMMSCGIRVLLYPVPQVDSPWTCIKHGVIGFKLVKRKSSLIQEQRI